MATSGDWVVVGLDNGGTSNNATVLDPSGRFLVDGLAETPSEVSRGTDAAVRALAGALAAIVEQVGIPMSAVRAVGLDTPGPASRDGVFTVKGPPNFGHSEWRGFDFRGALEAHLGLPVIYSNDGNAAALYAHHQHFAATALHRSSVAAIVGTGLGGGVVMAGQAVPGAAGMAGEFGHIHIPTAGLLAPGQPEPTCNCGLTGDAESIASLTGIKRNLLPYWLSRYPDHPLASVDSPAKAALRVRGYGEEGDPMALRIFEQQAMALGRLFTIAANFTDPDAYFVGGGVVEAAPRFRDWFLDTVREHTLLRAEQAATADFALVPDRDMAGARGAALAALEAMQAGS
ncbi:MAG: ROK family protein [Streptosporangiaceae bacterium]